ncbi:unnamed protein product [Mycena citricolor]|uniref:Uncharacterized protein n=1 Tax=Mycena citricolor TaxID=2018698 RepID=A0AAD2H053_9AGAR|nr:unnamed protein product [Mycena citricolor]
MADTPQPGPLPSLLRFGDSSDHSPAQIQPQQTPLPAVYRQWLTPPNQRVAPYQTYKPIHWHFNSQERSLGSGTPPQLPSSSPPRSSSPICTSEPEGSLLTAAVTSERSRKPRNRVTKKNPVFGEVQGAMRGSKHISILRNKALRDKVEVKSEASARFLRLSADIIERCERLSVETGSWVHFSAQHRFAADPFLHYTSPALLKEAKQDMTRITNDFSKLFKTLMAARNESTKELHKKLTEAQEKEKEAAAALEQSQQNVADAARQMEMQAEELRAKELELESYRIRLRMAQGQSK